MIVAAQKVKAKMLEMTQLFGIERSFFQKFVIIHRYIRYLNTEPLTKGILQKMFDNTARIMGNLDNPELNEDEFLNVRGEIIFENDFWNYYQNLELIYDRMKKLHSCQLQDKAEYDNLCRLLSKPYSKEMLALSFKVVNSNIFEHLEQDMFLEENRTAERQTSFDETKSVLHLNGEAIKINLRSKLTSAHKILRHIFVTNRENIGDDFYYSEIAEDEFGELEYKARPNNWKKYSRACEYVNLKVCEQTKDKISDFLVYNTGSSGMVKINEKYL